MANYFYTDARGQKQGPINDQLLQSLAAQGVIKPQTPLETDTGHKGVAGQIPGLTFAASPFPAQASPFAPTNTGIGYFDVLRKYAQFSGRARRKEYWMFILINTIVWFGLCVVAGMIGGIIAAIAAGAADAASGAEAGAQGGAIASTIVYWLYSLAVALPTFGVLIRRLHDTGRSGWWFFVCAIPIIGAIALLVFLVQDSQPEANKYGPCPK